MSMRVKGAVLLARRVFVLEEHGEEAWQAVLAELPEKDRELLGGFVLTASWYPFELNERLDAAVVQQVGGGDPAIFKQIGAWSAKKNLAGPHRTFLTPGDPQRFLAITDRIYSFYYDSGHRVFESTGPRSGVMTTYEAETFSKTDCQTVIGWYEEALAMCGASQVKMLETACRADGAPHCRYEIDWQV